MTIAILSFFRNAGAVDTAAQKSAPSIYPVTIGSIEPATEPATEIQPPTELETLEKTMKSFFERLLAGVESMWHKAPAIEVALASAVNNLVPVVEKLDVIVLGPEALILNPILDKVKVGLSALKDTIQSAGSNANLNSIVGAVQSHLGELVAAAQVKNTELAAKIKEVTDVVSVEVKGIYAGASAVAPPSA